MINQRRIRRRGRKRNRLGATAVEFAITAPALFLVIFCSAEFARLSMMRNLAQAAAYEACRAVIVEGADNDDAIAQANHILNRLGTRDAVIDINDGVAIEFDTPEVTITIDIPMASNAFFFPMAYGDRIITSTMTLRTERYSGFYSDED